MNEICLVVFLVINNSLPYFERKKMGLFMSEEALNGEYSQ